MNSPEPAKNNGQKDQRFSPPAVSLPKGGGAIKGIGEKFAANPVTGTGSFSIPLPLSPGRAGFTPALSLSYDSGSGNGPYGFGWSVGYPSITRRTDRGIPRYLDHQESDVYILSGAEDLVPVLNADGSRFEETRDGYRITRYRPRIEGLFARIERWTNVNDPSDTFWRSISRDNVTTFYGKTAESRIADPESPTRIFNWLVCESFDDKGNAAVYEYVAEDGREVNASLASEFNRTEVSRSANRYLKRVKYANRVSRLVELDLGKAEWLFELVMDYGDHEGEIPGINPTKIWPDRPDPFSNYRAGFEVRTYRRCQRVLMFHRFAELGPEPKLVRSLELDYEDFVYKPGGDAKAELEHQGSTRIGSFLRRATMTGYADNGLQRSMPPLELTYSRPQVSDETRTLEDGSHANLPGGVDGVQYQWIDLDSEGLSGVLTDQGGAWWYKPNLGGGRLGPLQLVAQKPSVGIDARVQFLDLAGDGPLELVQLDRPNAGFFERDEQNGWSQFTPFASQPNIEWEDRNLRFVDLTGDGHADVMITEDDVISWHPSLAEEGFGPRESLRMPADESLGPKLVFNDTTETIFLADMSGDGLSDIVRIRNGEVCYWPNLGYGRFGPKVTMDDAPVLDAPELFEPNRIRLADIDGSGVVDIIYLAGDGVRLYFNRSGNGWSLPYKLANFPPIDNVASVNVTDLLGNGTACLVWSSPLPGEVLAPLRYVDLMGNQKPHLLTIVENNLGARTRIEYVSSTRFYLEDKLAGRPWITRLPFPVHVVERTETFDAISRNRFVTRYKYHHGYFDGVEREFRGFGMVEQFDTEEFAALNKDQQLSPATNIDPASHIPPVLTKTWFHTGAFFGRDHVSNFFAGLLDEKDKGEYYREPGLTEEQAKRLLLDDTILPQGLTAEEEREACRALKGAMLRQEVYALDGTAREDIPYSVAEQNFTVRRVQKKGDNPHAVFFSHPREAISYHYERNPADPRVQHALTLEVDEFGNVLKSAAVAYGRRMDAPDEDLSPTDREHQRLIHITCTESTFTFPILDKPDDYRTPLPAESCMYELRKPVQEKSDDGLTELNRFDAVLSRVNQAADGQHDVAYEDIRFDKAQQAAANNAEEGKRYFRRLIEHVRMLYRPDDLGAAENDALRLLPPREMESLALPGESYKLAFTPGLLAQVYRRPLDTVQEPGAPPPENLLPVPADVLPVDVPGGKASDRGGYVDLDGDGRWWIPTGRVFFSPNTDDTSAEELKFAREYFFLPHRFRDPFHTSAASTESFIKYDGHKLLMLETRDALSNRVTVGERKENGEIDPSVQGNDYRVLQPRIVTDPNGNRAAVSFDALGMVVGTAVMGKRNENPRRGDLLDGFVPDLAEGDVIAHLTNPLAAPHDILKRATTRLVYDLFAYHRTKNQAQPAPNVVYTMARETHDADPGGAQTKIQHSFSYSDGFGREIQKKIQAEPGRVPKRDSNGKIIVGADGQPQMTTEDFSPRWVGSGWTVFNNKGKPVRQYEPFFTDTHRFEFDVRIGVSPIIFYDLVERVVATLHPNHTWEKVVFDPWRQTTYDVNDTVTFDPKTDPDVSGFFTRLPDGDYLPTWREQRLGLDANDPERIAADKAAAHADTPTVAHFDSLGRPFLTIAHNKVVCPGHKLDGKEEKFHTRVELDIEGNQRAVRDAITQNGDAQGRVVMRYDYDMLGNRIHQASMEASERWMLNDVAGQPIYAWDSRDHRFQTTYDQLRRPEKSFLKEGSDEPLLIGRTVYGETLPNPEVNNLRGKVVKLFDQAGVVTSDDYDFKGNLLKSQRQLAREYKATLNWVVEAAIPLEDDIFRSSTIYDALNRPTEMIAPDNSRIRPGYNEANLLERMDVNLRGATEVTHFVNDIDYNAKGQRTLIDLGNGVGTIYQYDLLTFRLSHLHTKRGNEALQDLRYTYDPAGNITHIQDSAQQTIYFNGQVVMPSNEYTYDAVYRLINATGREHIGQISQPETTWDDRFRVNLPHPNDGQAMRFYTELYEYDAVGNFQQLIHQATKGEWTRSYSYNEPSLIEPIKQSNRLSSTTVRQTIESYTHDAHGNMTKMPHLPLMQLDYRDQLKATSKQVNNSGTPEITHYVYDASGQRVRKVTEHQADAGQTPKRKEERIYLSGFEIYRRYESDGETVKLERETLHVMDNQQRTALVETRTLDTAGTDPTPQQLTRYQFGNHLDSASLELNDQAQIISYEEYYPFGSTSYQAVKSVMEVPKRYRYTRKERDEETGFTYHGARYYAPWLGRWTAPDPGGMKDGLNLYIYCRDNPIIFHDLDGRDSTTRIPGIATGEETLDEIREKAREAGYGFKRPPTWDSKRMMWNFGENNLYKITRPFGEKPLPGTISTGTYETNPSSGGDYDPFAPKQSKTNGGTGESTDEKYSLQPPSELPVADEDFGTVGKPGFGESLIPVWGSGREAIYHFQKGNYGRGIFFTVLAITDIFLVGALVKAIVKGFGKLSSKWAAKRLAAKEAAKEAAKKIFLPESEAVLAVIKDGEILAHKFSTGSLSHEKLVIDAFGKEVVQDTVEGGKKLIGVLEGAEVVTIGKLDGEITAFLSRTFYDRELPASQAAIDAARKMFK